MLRRLLPLMRPLQEVMRRLLTWNDYLYVRLYKGCGWRQKGRSVTRGFLYRFRPSPGRITTLLLCVCIVSSICVTIREKWLGLPLIASVVRLSVQPISLSVSNRSLYIVVRRGSRFQVKRRLITSCNGRIDGNNHRSINPSTSPGGY